MSVHWSVTWDRDMSIIAGSRVAWFGASAGLAVWQDRTGDPFQIRMQHAQSGRRSSLHLLSVRRDGDIIAAARSAAEEVVTADPSLGQHPGLASAVGTQEDQLDYADKG